MTTAMKIDEEWIQKCHSHKPDLNLQVPAENELTKLEADEISINLSSKSNYSSSITTTSTTIKSSDSYLQSILSSSSSSSTSTSPTRSNTSIIHCLGSDTCSCYKCQRQRRRAGIHQNTINIIATETTLDNNSNGTNKSAPNPYTISLKKTENTISNPSMEEGNNFNSSSSARSFSLKKQAEQDMTSVITPLSSPINSPLEQQNKRSNTVRKVPTLKSYEKYMPKPSYSQQDSIYRFEQQKESTAQKEVKKDLNEIIEQPDNYRISWKEDGTGDDLLTSLVTFQTIFEEKGSENEGLSDLLEQRAKELKHKKIQEQQEAKKPKEVQVELPPRQPDCLTLSYRNGPRHRSLTLYHTMKLNDEKERTLAYNIAYRHCINANSGLKFWVNKPRVPPVRDEPKQVHLARKPTLKKMLLSPLSSRKNKFNSDDYLSWSNSSDSLKNKGFVRGKTSIEMISGPIHLSPQNNNNDRPIEIVSDKNMILPVAIQNKMSFDLADISRVRQFPSMSSSELKDTSSISSYESTSGTTSQTSSNLMKNRPGRLFSSLGRKTSRKSKNRKISVRSTGKVEHHNNVTESITN